MLKKRIYRIVEVGGHADRFGRIFNGGLIVLILLSVCEALLSTDLPLIARYGSLFIAVEVVCGLFTR